MLLWQHLTLQERIRRLRYILPPLLVMLVVGYQLGIARTLALYGHAVHFGIEIAFYSLAGPAATWLTLVWVEQRLAEKELLEQQFRARERHLASLTNASADAILSIDPTGCIVSWNRGAQQIFGYQANAVLGQPLQKLLPDTPLLFDRLQRDGVVQNFETSAIVHDGRAITVALTQTRLTDHPADPLTSSLIMRDITARRERDAILAEERARIARDLHDGVAQVLYLLALKADMAAGQITINPTQVQTELQEIGRRSRQVIREIRRTIFALRPLDWSSDGFTPALRRFVKDFAEQLNWRAFFYPENDTLFLPDRLQPTVFRLVQESLNNVAKHAEAKQVWVTLTQRSDPPVLTVTVRDDGAGFAPAAGSGTGLGLRQMQKRLETVGGTITLGSSPGNGTTISAQIPL